MRLIIDPHCIDSNGKKTKIGLSSYASFGFYRGLNYVYHGSYSTVEFTPATVRAIREWPENQVFYQTPLIVEMMDRKLAEEASLRATAIVQDNWFKGIPQELPYTETALPLKEYQRVGAYLLSQASGYALFMEQGTGKTPTVISRILDEAKKKRERCAANSKLPNGPLRVLVVCPPALKLNWMAEFEKFSTLKGYHYNVHGDQTSRMINILEAISHAKSHHCHYVAIVVSYDVVVNSESFFCTMSPWDIVVSDESHWFKDSKTQRARTMLKLRDNAKLRYPLTGTPVGNNYGDLYTQLEFVDQGASGHSSYKDFVQHYCVMKPAGPGITSIVGTRCDDDLKEVLAQRSFIVKKEQVLKDLPEMTFEYNETEMVPEQAKQYKEMATFLITQLEGVDWTQPASAQHVLTQLLRLAQITSGFLALDEVVGNNGEVLRPKSEYFYPTNGKINRLIELANELPPNEKMIIWNVWIPLIEPIMAAMTKAGHNIVKFRGTENQRHAAKEQYNNDPATRFILCNPQSAGVGLNLIGYPPGQGEKYETNTSTEVFVSYNWSFLQRDQALARAHRIGTRSQIRVVDLVVDGSIDMDIMDAVRNKRDISNKIRDIREIVERLAASL